MRILAVADLHGVSETYRAVGNWAELHRPDAVLLGGDLLRPLPGRETLEGRFRACAEWMSEALDPVPCPIYYVMGNDDMAEWAPPQARFQSVHTRRLEQDGWAFVGYQYSLPLMGGIFEKEEEEIADDVEELRELVDARTVLLTHAPAAGVHDSGSSWPVGSSSLAELIRDRGPRLHVHGHTHRHFGRTGIHFNVAAGRTPRGMLIDLESLTHEVLGATA